jgi:site-specific recombinase XerD
VTNLRRRMLEELQRRNYSPTTIRGYLHAVEQFAKRFGKSPDKLGPDDLRSYQAYLLTERKLAVGSVVGRVAALRFFFVRTLKRREFREELPYPKDPKDRRRLDCPSTLVRALLKDDWVVYAKPAFGDPVRVLRYLGRYITASPSAINA